MPSSDTVRNTSGLSSVLIRLTAALWHLRTRTLVCRAVYSVSLPVPENEDEREGGERTTSVMSNTRTCLSRATDAL